MTRVRTRGSVVALPGTIASIGSINNASGSTPIDKSATISTEVGTYESFEDELTPGYFSSRRKGSYLTVNPADSTKIILPDQPLTVIYSYRLKNNPTTVFGEWTDTSSAWPISPLSWGDLNHVGSPPDPDDALADAIAYVLSDLWDMGTFLAEAGKTASMFTTLMSRVISTYRDIRRAVSRGDPSKVIENVSRIWLEARYGWRPTYYDLLDIQQAVDRLREGVMEELVRRSVTLESSDTASRRRGYQSANSTPADLSVTRVTRHVSRAGAIGLLDTRIPVFLDPLVTGWEIVPFSFVIDWFINVGSLLQTITPFSRGELKGAWISSFSETSATYVVELIESSFYERSIKSSGPYTCSRRTYHREPRSRNDAELRFRNTLNLFKASDLAALFLARNGNQVQTRR